MTENHSDASVMVEQLQRQVTSLVAERDRLQRMVDTGERLRESMHTVYDCSVLLAGVTDADLDHAIEITDMHASEYGELENALVILRLVKRRRAEHAASDEHIDTKVKFGVEMLKAIDQGETALFKAIDNLPGAVGPVERQHLRELIARVLG